MKNLALLGLSASLALTPVASLACGFGDAYDPYTHYVSIRGVVVPVRLFSPRILNGQRQAPPLMTPAY